METYQLICQKIGDHSLYGKVIGLDLELIESTLQKLKKTAKEEIIRLYQENPYEVEVDIVHPTLRTVSTRVSLAYFSPKGPYPVAEQTKFKVSAVYGESPEGNYYRCYLPFLNEDFYYYDEKQLTVLIEHFFRENLNGIPPEQAHRFLMNSRPWLEEIKVRLPDLNRTSTINHEQNHHLNFLQAVAERLPVSDNWRKKGRLAPETAWEQAEILREAEALILDEKANLLLVGESGVGKSTVLLELIKQLHKKSRLGHHPLTFWKSTSRRLIAKAKYLGEWQEICEELVEHLEAVNGILWVSDILQLMRVGGSGPEDSVAAFLLPLIREGKLRLLGEVHPRELAAAQSELPGFLEHFRSLKIEEMEQSRVLRVMEHFQDYVANNFHIELTPPALDLAYRLSRRFVSFERFPGKLLHLLTDTVKNASQEHQSEIAEQQIIDTFIQRTGLPEIILHDEIPFAEAEMTDYFSQHIIGQTDAVKALASVVNTYKAGLNDPGKPIATLLFAGPTGVGKTMASKKLAEFFFSQGQKQDPLFRIDMSEYQYADQIRRLIGAGDTPGKLVQHVRNRPFSVILFDEIEKADPVLFDVLMNIMDEGLFTDAQGRLADFRSSILIMTTNIGAQNSKTVGFQQVTDDAEAEIRSYFRPEFFNRIDRVLQFYPLSQQDIESVARKELNELRQREGICKYHLKLEFTDNLVRLIVARGFDAKYGARPLQRAIEQHVVAKLGTHLLENPALQDTTLVLDVEGDTVVCQAGASRKSIPG